MVCISSGNEANGKKQAKQVNESQIKQTDSSLPSVRKCGNIRTLGLGFKLSWPRGLSFNYTEFPLSTTGIDTKEVAEALFVLRALSDHSGV